MRKLPRTYKRLREQVVILRPIPETQELDQDGEFTIGNLTFLESEYQRIVEASADAKMYIEKNRITHDGEDAFPVSDNRFYGIAIPPILGMETNDMLLRIEKDNEILYIEGVFDVDGVQEILLTNREKVRPGTR